MEASREAFGAVQGLFHMVFTWFFDGFRASQVQCGIEITQAVKEVNNAIIAHDKEQFYQELRGAASRHRFRSM